MTNLVPTNSIQSAYNVLKNKPFGLAIMSRIIGWKIPYTGSIAAKIEVLEPGFARISMKDRRRIRNHLNSIHAIALMNLGEFSTGLSVHYDLSQDCRAILTKLSMEYLKKARGKLIAEARCEKFDQIDKKEITVKAHIYDASKTIVAVATATWLISRKS